MEMRKSPCPYSISSCRQEVHSAANRQIPIPIMLFIVLDVFRCGGPEVYEQIDSCFELFPSRLFIEADAPL